MFFVLLITLQAQPVLHALTIAALLRSILGYFTLVPKPKRNSLSRKWLREEVDML